MFVLINFPLTDDNGLSYRCEKTLVQKIGSLKLVVQNDFHLPIELAANPLQLKFSELTEA